MGFPGPSQCSTLEKWPRPHSRVLLGYARDAAAVVVAVAAGYWLNLGVGQPRNLLWLFVHGLTKPTFFVFDKIPTLQGLNLLLQVLMLLLHLPLVFNILFGTAGWTSGSSFSFVGIVFGADRIIIGDDWS